MKDRSPLCRLAYRIDEAAEVIGISRAKVQELVRGTIPHVYAKPRETAVVNRTHRASTLTVFWASK